MERNELGQIVKGDGRPAGAVNKLTKTVKEAVLDAFNELQQDPNQNLAAFAKKYPRDFYAIAAKLIPTDMRASIVVEERKMIIIEDDDKSQPIGTTPG